jgi:alpha-L-fucosidase
VYPSFRTINQTEIQLVEVTVNNLAVSANSSDTSTWLIEPVQLSISSDSVHTIIPATINRLRGGDQVRVVVGIVNADGVNPGTVVDGVSVLVDGEALNGVWDILAGIPDYQYGDESLRTHESPEWFNSVKFGIFVHWGAFRFPYHTVLACMSLINSRKIGIYSVPAWTVSGTQYAEWYWYWQHNPANESSAVWTYHKETYGADFLYDMFFPNFTGTEWSAEGLLQFVQDSGAKYYVCTKFLRSRPLVISSGCSEPRSSRQSTTTVLRSLILGTHLIAIH